MQRWGIHFRYPREFLLEIDTESPDVTIWTLSGNDCKIMIMKYARLEPASLLNEVVPAMAQQYGLKNVKQSNVVIRLHDHKFRGKRLDIKLAGIQLRQDVCAFSNASASFVLVIQDCPKEDGSPTEDTLRATKYLKES